MFSRAGKIFDEGKKEIETPNLKIDMEVGESTDEFPVTKYRKEILTSINNNLVTIISAPTGTGKVSFFFL